MSPLPALMADRWHARPEPKPGQAQLYWHMLMRDQPQVCALAALARQRLDGFPGLHFAPGQWLHVSVLRLGLDSDIPSGAVDVLVRETRQRLQAVAPATVTLGRVLYHPEAITLGVGPDRALDPVAAAIREAARSTPGIPGDGAHGAWIPHVTVAYSTQEQVAGPIVAALGRELPSCQVTIDSVSLVAQHGPERAWNWEPLAHLPLGTAPGGSG
jgi:2'-5' RNA ligase